MLRNIAAVTLVSYILYNKFKLNYIECFILNFLIVCYLLGNITFYFLEYYPNNKLFHFMIYGGTTWYEFPVTFSIMILLSCYLILTRNMCKK